jgi:hypothetical protein
VDVFEEPGEMMGRSSHIPFLPEDCSGERIVGPDECRQSIVGCIRSVTDRDYLYGAREDARGVVLIDA